MATAKKAASANSRPATKIKSLADGLLSRYLDENSDDPPREDIVNGLSKISDVAQSIRADTGTSDERYQRKHGRKKRKTATRSTR